MIKLSDQGSSTLDFAKGRALKAGRFRCGLDASRTTSGRALACNEARQWRELHSWAKGMLTELGVSADSWRAG
jgi:hypothetical protein